MLGWFGDLVARLEHGRRCRVLELLANRPMSEVELGSHFFLPLTLGWHLRELNHLGLVAYNRRAARHHLVWPALEALASFCSKLDSAIPTAALTPRGGASEVAALTRPGASAGVGAG